MLTAAKAQIKIQQKVTIALLVLYVMSRKYSLVVCIQDGWTALHKASEKGHSRVVKLLIAAKAQVDIKDKVRF